MAPGSVLHYERHSRFFSRLPFGALGRLLLLALAAAACARREGAPATTDGTGYTVLGDASQIYTNELNPFAAPEAAQSPRELSRPR